MEITVVDTGIGMNSEGISLALTPFGHVNDEFVRNFDGTGLGLPLTVGLVKAHGGELYIQSEPGKGTKVRVVFPSERTATSDF